MSVADEILAIAEEAANLAAVIPNPEVQAGDAIAQGLLGIIQKCVTAYESHTGQPIDVSQLHRIEPVA